MRVFYNSIMIVVIALWFGSSQAAGDPMAGKYLSSQCIGCHGIPRYTNAYPTYYVPKLWGQHEAYLLSALQGYRDGARKHPTMQGQAASLSDQQMADLAAYFSQN